MPQVPQGHDASSKDQSPLKTHIFRAFSGVNTAASRNAIPDDKVYNLENIIPIGPQNAVVTQGAVPTGLDFGPGNETIYYADSANLKGVEYIILFAVSGNVYIFNTDINQAEKINPNNLQLNGSGSRCDQWNNTAILFTDHTGYYSYDGTTFQQITGPGIPISGSDIAVYANRVWIVFGRVLFTSGAGGYTAPFWLPQNGASFNILVDPQIRSDVTRLKAANGLLYVFADSGINAIYNVTVPIGAVPPTPIYQNQNIQPLIGTDQPASVVPFGQAMLFSNKYGVYNIYGVNAPKISDDINGTWQNLNFTGQPIFGGQCVVEGIMCAAMLINRSGDINFTSGPVLAMWYPQGDGNSWWFSRLTDGPLSLVVSAIVDGVATLYGMVGTRLMRLFHPDAAPEAALVSTKLWPLEDDLAQKEALRVGFLAKYTDYGDTLDMSVDGLNITADANITLALAQGFWINDSLDQGLWIDENGPVGPQQGGWRAPGFILASGNAPGMFSHNLGLTLRSDRYKYTLNFMAIDYKLRDRWT